MQRDRHVMAYQLEVGQPNQMAHILLGPRMEVVDAKDVIAARHKPPTRMAARKAGASGNQRPSATQALHRVNARAV